MTHDPTHAVVEFSDGLPGFEGCRRFVLLSGPAVQPFTIVQGLDPDSPVFAAIDPARVEQDYHTELSEADLARLGAGRDSSLVWLALVSPDLDAEPTVNLRAPLVINPATLRGIQLIQADSVYPLDQPLRKV